MMTFGSMEDCKRIRESSQGDQVIIPTPEFDPLFADDGISFRTKMIEYIRREFADVLGPRIGLLHSDEGLNDLAKMTRVDNRRSSSRSAA